ncbi:MAG: Choline-sulfatase [candidate division BRC1 bacterium ADurb.BinA364]|nr:MAG: Choline-sulfatase [candidate division BRC1 bacterium ADurb.BinA364]
MAAPKAAKSGLEARRPVASAKRPNVLIVLLDTASARFLSSYGYPDPTSPLMDRLAAEGTRFAYCYGNGPWTPPAHASLFTGTPSIVHKMNHDHINPQTKKMFDKVRFKAGHPTLANILGANGYQTVGICGNDWVGSKSNMCAGFQTWDNLRGSAGPAAEAAPKPAKSANRSAERAFAWADAKYDSAKPFFMFVNYLTPHLRRDPPEKYRRQFVKGRVPKYLHEISSKNCFHYIWNGLLKKEDMPIFNRLYAALIRQTDDQIGELLGGLKKRGMMDDTIVIVCADHGDENGEHNLLDHQLCVYNTLIHVPLIFWHPRLVPAGRVEEKPVQLSDVAPTVLDLVGLKAERKRQPQMEGLNLLTEVPARKSPRPIVAEHGVPRLIIRNALPDVSPEQYERYLRRLKAIVWDGWKYIWSSDGADELYDIGSDPMETTNLIREQPKKAKDLAARLAKWVEAHGETLERDKKRPKL